MPKKKITKNRDDYEKIISKEEKKIRFERKKRFNLMIERKKKLGINEKCDRMDDLYPPHFINIDNPNELEIMSDRAFGGDNLFTDNARKSRPIAFEKITTAVALLVKENPKIILKSFDKQSKDKDLLIENVYYENYRVNRKIRVLRKFVTHLAKYGIGYYREYIKKTYKKEHYIDNNGENKCKWVYDVFDQVAENYHPKYVVLDDNCVGVKDINKPARDCFFFDFMTKEDFNATYPEEVFKKSQYVKEGGEWLVDPNILPDEEKNTEEHQNEKKKILVIVYENKVEGLRETWANNIPLESVPLPGGELSIIGEKWVDNDENYDGIGIGQILEIYTPILDDILTASMERLRQIVRPNEDHFNNIENTDESDDVYYGAGATRKWNGSPADIVYSSPPPRSQAEMAEMSDLMEEIDVSCMVPRNLAGTDDAKTAYQSAQNREAALNKLSIPLDAIKFALEDAANLSLKLFKIIYQEPLETKLLSPGDEEFDEAMSILDAENYDSERVVVTELDEQGNPAQLARRKFRSFEFPIAKEYDEEEGKPTGRIVSSEEKKFWEIIPKTYNWNGVAEIIAESFLPPSKALDDEMKKNTIMDLMNVQTTDEMGNPILKDAQGQPYTIDRVQLLKERIRMGKDFNPDKIIVPLKQVEQVPGEQANPLQRGGDKISLNNVLGNTRPELKQPNALR